MREPGQTIDPAALESGTIDPDEIDRFAAQAAQWWDPSGSFRPLHQLNRARLAFMHSALTAHFARDERSLQPFAGLTLADIGCGGGLIAEPMTRLGFAVTGVDADLAAIEIARAHALSSGLAIDYRSAAAEDLAGEGAGFDVVLALEIVEHVADPDVFFATAASLVRPGGIFIGATLNRTARAFALAIVGAEYVLRWLPRGTHRWDRFLRPSEFVRGLRRNGLVATRLAGASYDPRHRHWAVSEDLSVNYMVAAVRPAVNPGDAA